METLQWYGNVSLADGANRNSDTFSVEEPTAWMEREGHIATTRLRILAVDHQPGELRERVALAGVVLLTPSPFLTATPGIAPWKRQNVLADRTAP